MSAFSENGKPNGRDFPMFRAVRRRMTWANIAMTLALVFAMAGGAYAAGSALTGKQKSEVVKIAKKYAGKAGAAGTQGPAGPVGPQGPAGAQGAAGKDGAAGEPGKEGKAGTNGKGVTVSGTAAGCATGGSTVEVEGSGVKHEICNGKDGQTGFTETLPVGKTEKGMWAIDAHLGEKAIIAFTPISFAIPTATPPKVHIMQYEETSGSCPGSEEEPTAASGQLCVYESPLSEKIVLFEALNTQTNGTLTSNLEALMITKAGVMIAWEARNEGFGFGTWAVAG